MPFRFFHKVVFALLICTVALPGCRKKEAEGSARWTADQFLKHYIQEADQEKARNLATGLAVEKLNTEIEAVRLARTGNENYTSSRSRINFQMRETRKEEDGKEVFIYTISLSMGDEKPRLQDFFVSLVEENGVWHVSNYEYFK